MRTFVAVEIDNNSSLEKIQEFQKKNSFNSKPVKIEQIHFTLQFIGEIDGKMLEMVKKSLNTIIFSKIEIVLRGIGAFPNSRSPKIIWVGVNEKSDIMLNNLANKVRTSLNLIGLESNNQFKPHITIFRIKNKTNDLSSKLLKFKKTEFGNQVVSKIKLKKSDLTTNGPVYTDLMEVNARE
jgi:2'-5' RNA ligase